MHRSHANDASVASFAPMLLLRQVLRAVRTLLFYLALGSGLTVATVWIQAVAVTTPDRWGGASWVGEGISWPWPAPEGWPKGANAIDEKWGRLMAQWGGTPTRGRVLFYAWRPNEDRFTPDRKPAWYHPPPPGTPISSLMASYDWNAFYFMTEIRYGLPVEAMRRVIKIEQGKEWQAPPRVPHDLGTWRYRWRNGLEIGSTQLPLMPMWPGFAIFATFWSGLIWGSRHGFSAINVYRRRRAGNCISCGYPTTNLAICPECGKVTGSTHACPSRPASDS